MAVVGAWQSVGMVVQLRSRLQAFLQYLTLFEKVYRLVCHGRCKLNGTPLVEKSSFIRIPIMKKGARVKEETVEAIMRCAVVHTHQLLSPELFDYIVSPFKAGDKLLSLLNLSLHRSAQLARSHEPSFVAEEAPDIALMDGAPGVHALCTDHVKPNREGHKDLRASLSFMIQLRVSILREYSTLTSELFATATQRPDKRGKSKTDSSHRPTNRDLYLQMVDLVGGSLNGDIPEAEVAAMLEESRVIERPTADLSAIDRAHIPTGQGYFLKKQQQ